MRTELHFHLLPGVDDGPRDEVEALKLARLAVADGTGRIVATPHVHLVDVEELAERAHALQRRLRAAGVELELLVGGELSPDHVGLLGPHQFELIAQGPDDRRWLLLEAPLFPTETDLASAADELRDRGFGVLIGHPERSPGLELEELRRQVAMGSVLQVNASSVTGRHGSYARDRALALARSGLPFVVASDAHSTERPPLMTEAGAELAAAGLDARTVRTALDTLPEALLVHGLDGALGVRGPELGQDPPSGRSRGDRSSP